MIIMIVVLYLSGLISHKYTMVKEQPNDCYVLRDYNRWFVVAVQRSSQLFSPEWSYVVHKCTGVLDQRSLSCWCFHNSGQYNTVNVKNSINCEKMSLFYLNTFFYAMLTRTKLDAKLSLCEEVAADRCRIRVYIRQVL